MFSSQDWQDTLDIEDVAARRNRERFWEKEKARLLADLERDDGDRPVSPPPPRRFGLFRRHGQDRGVER